MGTSDVGGIMRPENGIMIEPSTWAVAIVVIVLGAFCLASEWARFNNPDETEE